MKRNRIGAAAVSIAATAALLTAPAADAQRRQGAPDVELPGLHQLPRRS
ncbi:MAG: hypothetical protein WKF82_12430 [Nocardioidaceae bacterium]